MEHANGHAPNLAPTELGARMMHDGALADIAAASGADFLPTARLNVAILAGLCRENWFDAADVFHKLEHVGTTNGEAATFRGILIGEFAGLYAPDDFKPAGDRPDCIAAARRSVATAPDKVAAIEAAALALAIDIEAGRCSRPDAADALTEMAEQHGVAAVLGPDGVQNIIAMGLKGLAALAPRITITSDPVPAVANNAPALVMRRACDIEMRPVEWLWPGRIALGKLSLIAGEPGLGKSQLTAALAAAVTTGGRWPDGDECAPLGNVVFFSGEDDPADTLVPRLVMAGADLNRIAIIDGVSDGKGPRSFNLQTDLPLLESKIRELGGVRLIVIDPITAYIGTKIDSHKNAEVRSILTPLAALAAQWGAAVLGVTHFSKGGGVSAVNRFIGSIAFIAAARAAYVVMSDPDDEPDGRRLFCPVKNNLAPLGTGLSFRVEQRLIEGGAILASGICWGSDVVTRSADELLASGNLADQDARGEAAEWLKELLEAGPVPQRDIKAQADGAGLSWSTIKRAKSAAGVVAKRQGIEGERGGGRWLWSLPGKGGDGIKGTSEPLRGPASDVSPLTEFGPLNPDGADQPAGDPGDGGGQ